MRMPAIMTRTIKMLGGTSRISVRLSFLARFVRTITSLTCALGWDEASKFIAQGPAVLTNPLPHNQNMNSKSHDQSSDEDPPETSGRGCINWSVPRKL